MSVPKILPTSFVIQDDDKATIMFIMLDGNRMLDISYIRDGRGIAKVVETVYVER